MIHLTLDDTILIHEPASDTTPRTGHLMGARLGDVSLYDLLAATRAQPAGLGRARLAPDASEVAAVVDYI